ncbi:MAG: hypothetical protein CL943_02420 [Candidatus Diapherotrites archaeon]|uniref:Uncharacterized protein n=1 Tax=Candidatus Iainarchaeum sp. TaxID=3101447 RepID=A0A2D6M133_9ARCH|nr:hypothetical protein [Candidatus Diapherotrites archaeon]
MEKNIFTDADEADIFKKCGKKLEGDSFYFLKIEGSQGLLEAWLEPENLDILCIFRKDVDPTYWGCRNNQKCNDDDRLTVDECNGGECVHRTKACKEVEGKMCPSDWSCTTDLVTVYDIEECCLDECVEDLCEVTECENNEKCSEGNCALKTCEELDDQECPQMLRCAEDPLIAEDTNSCCLVKCEQINPCSEIQCPGEMRCREGTCVFP